MAALFILGCATEVREDHEYYKVEPNVKPAPPISNVTPAPPIQNQPVYSSTPVYNSTPVYSQNQPVQPMQPVQPIQPVVPSEPVMTVPMPAPQPTTPDWASQKIQATGQSAVNPAIAIPAQAKLMARRGAEMDAKRNLLERVLGLRLDSSTVVKDMVAESDLINAQTSGFIRDAYVVGENFDGSVYTVQMELNLYNVYTTMKTQKIYYK